MYKISLINMPFAAFKAPSLGLTQLKAALESQFKNRVSVEILYLNQDFARHMGIDTIQFIENSMQALNSGLGEWFFRRSAFLDSSDNARAYFQRYYPLQNDQTLALKRAILEKREGINEFLDQLIDSYKIDEADLVGFTSKFNQNVASFALARKLKARNPNIVVVMGGTNCETPMGEEIVKNVGQIDFVFSGPALVSFPKFVLNCLNGEMQKCHRIRGVFSRTNLGDVHSGIQGSIGEERDINDMAVIEYETFLNTFDKNFRSEKINPILFFETSRGCWWGERSHCTFCGLNGTTMHYRVMHPQKALDQFESLFRYADRCTEIQSVDNIMPNNYVQDVLPLLNPPPNACIFYEVRADLSREDLQVLSSAGVKLVQPGIESLATRTLKLIGKGITAFQNLVFLQNCVNYAVKPRWNLLIGFPGEAEAVYKKYVRDIPLLVHLPPPTGAYPVRFDRYSPYFVQAEKYGLDLRPYDFYGMIYPFSNESLVNMAYYFMDNNFGADYFTTMVKWIDQIRAEVDLWQKRWQGKNHALPPMLFFKKKGESNVVHDSRVGEIVEHQLSELDRQLLERLTSRKSVANLAPDLGHISRAEIEKRIRTLQEKGLVFGEGDRFISLVFDEEPQQAYQFMENSVPVQNMKKCTNQPEKPPLVRVSRELHRIQPQS